MYNDKIGLYIICLIGATCVGSISLLDKNNNFIKSDNVNKTTDYINNVLMDDTNYNIITNDINITESNDYFNNKKIINNDKINNLIGKDIELMEQLGLYQFGGSTAVIIIPKQEGKKEIEFCKRVIHLSYQKPISNESYTYVGQYIGQIKE